MAVNLSKKEQAREGGRGNREKKACTFAHMKELEGFTDDGYIRHCVLKSNSQIHPPLFIFLLFMYCLSYSVFPSGGSCVHLMNPTKLLTLYSSLVS